MTSCDHFPTEPHSRGKACTFFLSPPSRYRTMPSWLGRTLVSLLLVSACLSSPSLAFQYTPTQLHHTLGSVFACTGSLRSSLYTLFVQILPQDSSPSSQSRPSLRRNSVSDAPKFSPKVVADPKQGLSHPELLLYGRRGGTRTIVNDTSKLTGADPTQTSPLLPRHYGQNGTATAEPVTTMSYSTHTARSDAPTTSGASQFFESQYASTHPPMTPIQMNTEGLYSTATQIESHVRGTAVQMGTPHDVGSRNQNGSVSKPNHFFSDSGVNSSSAPSTSRPHTVTSFETTFKNSNSSESKHFSGGGSHPSEPTIQSSPSREPNSLLNSSLLYSPSPPLLAPSSSVVGMPVSTTQPVSTTLQKNAEQTSARSPLKDIQPRAWISTPTLPSDIGMPSVQPSALPTARTLAPEVQKSSASNPMGTGTVDLVATTPPTATSVVTATSSETPVTVDLVTTTPSTATSVVTATSSETPSTEATAPTLSKDPASSILVPINGSSGGSSALQSATAPVMTYTVVVVPQSPGPQHTATVSVQLHQPGLSSSTARTILPPTAEPSTTSSGFPTSAPTSNAAGGIFVPLPNPRVTSTTSPTHSVSQGVGIVKSNNSMLSQEGMSWPSLPSVGTVSVPASSPPPTPSPSPSPTSLPSPSPPPAYHPSTANTSAIIVVPNSSSPANLASPTPGFVSPQPVIVAVTPSPSAASVANQTIIAPVQTSPESPAPSETPVVTGNKSSTNSTSQGTSTSSSIFGTRTSGTGFAAGMGILGVLLLLLLLAGLMLASRRRQGMYYSGNSGYISRSDGGHSGVGQSQLAAIQPHPMNPSSRWDGHTNLDPAYEHTERTRRPNGESTDVYSEGSAPTFIPDNPNYGTMPVNLVAQGNRTVHGDLIQDYSTSDRSFEDHYEADDHPNDRQSYQYDIPNFDVIDRPVPAASSRRPARSPPLPPKPVTQPRAAQDIPPPPPFSEELSFNPTQRSRRIESSHAPSPQVPSPRSNLVLNDPVSVQSSHLKPVEPDFTDASSQVPFEKLRRKFVPPPSTGGTELNGTQVSVRMPFSQKNNTSFEDFRSNTPPEPNLESSGNKRSVADAESKSSFSTSTGDSGKQFVQPAGPVVYPSGNSNISDAGSAGLPNGRNHMTTKISPDKSRIPPNVTKVELARAIYQLNRRGGGDDIALQSTTTSRVENDQKIRITDGVDRDSTALGLSSRSFHEDAPPWPHFSDGDSEFNASIASGQSPAPAKSPSPGQRIRLDTSGPQIEGHSLAMQMTEKSGSMVRNKLKDDDESNYVPIPDQTHVISYLRRKPPSPQHRSTSELKKQSSSRGNDPLATTAVQTTADELRKRREPFVRMQAARLSRSPMGETANLETSGKQTDHLVPCASSQRPVATNLKTYPAPQNEHDRVSTERSKKNGKHIEINQKSPITWLRDSDGSQ